VTKSGIATEGVSIVARGEFNPLSFSPQWFYDNDLVGRTELQAQDIEFLTPDGSSFTLGWLEVNDSPNVLQMVTVDVGEIERLRDAFIGALAINRESPVGALGINRYFHVTVDTRSYWHNVGHRLVPQSNWDGILNQPGMRAVTVWGTRNDGHTGRVQVQVEPSQVVPQSVFISHNDHFSLSDLSLDTDDESSWEGQGDLLPTTEKSRKAIAILAEEWQHSMQSANNAQERIIRLGIDA
jgi:hypothetical protein